LRLLLAPAPPFNGRFRSSLVVRSLAAPKQPPAGRLFPSDGTYPITTV